MDRVYPGRFCILCHGVADFMCIRCRDPYCSSTCQKMDWQQHKSICFPMPKLVRYVSESDLDSISSKIPPEPFKSLQTSKMSPSNAALNNDKNIFINDKPDGNKSKTMYYKETFDGPTLVGKTFKVPTMVEKPVEGPTMLEKTVELPKAPERTVKVIGKTIEVSMKKEPESERIEPPAKSEIFMKPFPLEENEFVSVEVQYVSSDNSIWVMHEKNESASHQLLREINKTAFKASIPELEQIKVNSMFSVPFEEIYYRGIVLEPVSATGTVLVRLIDYGNEITVSIDDLKSPIPVMSTLMAFSFPIKFKNPRKAAIGDKLKIKMEEIKNDVMTVVVEGESTVITMKDIEVVPIPIGAKKNLFCLDFTNIDKGYISACVYDEQAMQRTKEMSANITNHCKRSKEAYSPKIGELCLTLYEDDEWYRTVAIDVKDGNTFDILFIDYGNIATVVSSSIRKMSKEFMHKCFMNECYIKDFPKKPSKGDIQRMALFFDDNPIFEAEVQMESGTYIIDPVL